MARLTLPSLVIAALVAAACGGGGGARVMTPGATPAGAKPAAPQAGTPVKPGQPIEAPKTDPTPPPIPRGVIAGRVTAFATKEPLARARVILRADTADLPLPRVALTDADGSFRFVDLPASKTYLLTVTKTGFAPRGYGEAPPAVPPSFIPLAQDEVKENLQVHLTSQVTMTGRVLDEDGTPFSGALVEAMRPVFEGDRRTLVPVSEAITDDRGEFRLVGLSPGQYYLSAFDPAFAQVGDKEGELFYSPTFYPGVAFPDEATRITLDAGGASDKLEFRLRIIKPARVQGRILPPVEGLTESKPLISAAVTMSPLRNDQFSMFTTSEATLEPGGGFLFSNVPPGRYRIQARGENQREGVTLFSLFTIPIEGTDKRDIVMQMAMGADVYGHVEWESTTGRVPDRTGIIVRMPMEDGNRFSDAVSGYIQADDTWRIKGAMAGRHYFVVDGLPPGWYMKRVEYQGVDITDTPWRVDYEQVLKGFRVIVSQRATIVRGFVSAPAGEDVQSYAVVAFPTNATHWRPNSRYIKLTYPDEYGRYQFEGLPAGFYMLAATRNLDRGDLGDPRAFDLLLEGKGIETLQVQEGPAQRRDLKPVVRRTARGGY